MGSVLIIDDEKIVTRIFAEAVRQNGHQPLEAHSLAEGLAVAYDQNIDLILLDVRFPEGNGIEAVQSLRQTPGEPEIIIVTGYGDPDAAEQAMHYGAWDYVLKPPDMDLLAQSLSRALAYRKQRQETRESLSLERDQIIGTSPSLNRSLDQAAQAAASDINVLLTGETGTGKELYAGAIHATSARGKSNFVVVDCAALCASLAESELFGHEKGAFTGAEKKRKGLVCSADGGTLFLDEIGELSLDLQKKLLRVLQEKKFHPVGSEQELRCDFRIIAATNKNLKAMVEAEKFRSDLLYRLSAFTLDIPPLRERKQDIPDLIDTYVVEACKEEKLPCKQVASDFYDIATNFPWPGNVRELVGAVYRSVSIARQEPVLFARHLPKEIRVHQLRSEVSQSSPSPSQPQKSMPPLQDVRNQALSRAEKNYLQELVEFTNKDISSSCEISGLSRSRLYALLKKHDIQY
ncbi:sigma-54-dependent transcriptional regulator [Desulfohalobium retbaense]|uniref:Two component, sigma54 specific, transcriptional regulator, Fis family n=1 Tax=Desulfohalobium retbaense (strain ATCC 49708 / DSM 5692 / JCM 16813 / HR100) TaxID=485915 RepID=C8X1C8_DESRD|nr:sigma-54 dependent transcriptional regulator [Desulfohalobium retbaense]ACV68225.1 putative two component, sigma54 specific, transcriptional regulator, Fis family [Desulfohalobium retbaense DSM 5692]